MARARKGDGGAEAEDAGHSQEGAAATAAANGGTAPSEGPEGRPAPAVVETGAVDAGQVETEEPLTAQAPDAVAAEPARSKPDARQRGGLLPTVLGGMIAAGLGFGAASYILPRFMAPSAQTDELAALGQTVARQAETIAALSESVEARATQSDLAELAAAQSALGDTNAQRLAAVNEAVEGLDARLAEMAVRLDGLEARLTELEKRPVAGGAASATALEAFGREMEALRSEMTAQKAALAEARSAVAAEAERASERIAAAAAEADRLRSEAEQTARMATIRAAMGRIEAALMTGGALGPALADLRGAGIEVPAALAEQAQGVPTLEALRAAFPPAARDALAASLKETAQGSAWDRTLAFLRTQAGARSLTPREGSDPDAVLSRAEAALAAGDLQAGLAEIGTLPASGQARLAEWVALASRRIAATEAAAALAVEVK